MAKILVLRGIPASGKTTFAKSWVAENPEGRVRVNRDDLRAMLYGAGPAPLNWKQEQHISAVEKQIAKAALDAGKDVVVDAMNLRSKWARLWFTLGYPVEFQGFEVDLDSALLHNAERGEPVPQDAIRSIYAKFTKDGKLLPPPELQSATATSIRYEPGETLAFSFDIDGTLALMGDRRSPYDPTKYHLDEPNLPVVETLGLLTDALETYYGYCEGGGKSWAIIGMSGRSEDYRAETEAWLKEHDIELDALFMRKSGDTRNDGLVKQEMVRDNVNGKYNVIAHFDDRNRVVDALRAIGMTVFQVAPGAF